MKNCIYYKDEICTILSDEETLNFCVLGPCIHYKEKEIETMSICFFSNKSKKTIRNKVNKIVKTDYGFRIYYKDKNQLTFLDYEDVYSEDIESPIHIILD